MIVRGLDQDGDWTFGGGKSNYLSGNAAISQNLQTRISSFIGDCFFDLGAGIDWFNYCAGSKSQLAVQLSVSAVILNTYGVTGVSQLSVILDSQRNLNIAYKANTIFSGTVSKSVLLLTDASGNILTDYAGNPLTG